jgi:sortase A
MVFGPMSSTNFLAGLRNHAPRYVSKIKNAVPRDFRSAKRQWPMLLLLIGVALLIYVGAQYGQMFWEQHQLESQWKSQQQRRAQQAANPGDTSAPVDDGLTRLSIPKIDFDAVVVEGTTRKKLLLGPGHMEETPAPGTEGNSVITAHRDTFFRHIVELAKGDELVVQRNGKKYTYEVQSKRVVKPEDVSVIKPTKDSRITLITCYPTYYIGPAPERLVVMAKLKEGEATQPTKPVSDPTSLPGDTSDSAKQ